MTTKTLSIYIAIDHDGDYVVGDDRDSALEQYEDTYGRSSLVRVVHIAATVHLPDDSQIAVTEPVAVAPDTAAIRG